MVWCGWGGPARRSLGEGGTPRPSQADSASRAPIPATSADRSANLVSLPPPGATRPSYTRPKAPDPSRNPFTRNNLNAIFQHLRLARPGKNPLPTRKFLPAL